MPCLSSQKNEVYVLLINIDNNRVWWLFNMTNIYKYLALVLWGGEKNPITGRGILKGRGTCHCDTVCYCGASSSDSSQKKSSLTTNAAPIATTSQTMPVIEHEFQKIITNISRRTSGNLFNYIYN